jgi:phosphomannomutase
MTMKISADSKNAFKSVDIRGVYPTEVNDELVYLIARSFVEEYSLKKVLVARDMRLSSPALFTAFASGANDAGADVIDLGLVHTPALYFASGSMKLAGVMITASHSPKNQNGLKMVLGGAIPLTENFGLKQIRKRIEKGIFKEVKKPGKVVKKDIKAAYLKFVLKGIKTKGMEDIEVVADAGNGMGAVLMELLPKKLPVSFTTLNQNLDGRFPSRGSDPALKKNQKHITTALKTGGFDFGISFDGDGDRIAFFDEEGNYINSAAVGALIATVMLKKKKGAKIGYTNLDSRIFEETIKLNSGVATPVRVGHAYIKETMREKDVLFACEHSGHFYFKEFFYTDSVSHTLRYILLAFLEAKSAGLTFKEMMEPYLPYKQTEDVFVEVLDTKKAQAAVEAYLKNKKPIRTRKFDGLWVDFGDVWGSVKVSVTERALKMMFESTDKRKAQKLQDEIVAFTKSIAKD